MLWLILIILGISIYIALIKSTDTEKSGMSVFVEEFILYFVLLNVGSFSLLGLLSIIMSFSNSSVIYEHEKSVSQIYVQDEKAYIMQPSGQLSEMKYLNNEGSTNKAEIIKNAKLSSPEVKYEVHASFGVNWSLTEFPIKNRGYYGVATEIKYNPNMNREKLIKARAIETIESESEEK